MCCGVGGQGKLLVLCLRHCVASYLMLGLVIFWFDLVLTRWFVADFFRSLQPAVFCIFRAPWFVVFGSCGVSALMKCGVGVMSFDLAFELSFADWFSLPANADIM